MDPVLIGLLAYCIAVVVGVYLFYRFVGVTEPGGTLRTNLHLQQHTGGPIVYAESDPQTPPLEGDWSRVKEAPQLTRD